ncbi:hypothetical protein H5410_045695 [Solanum commersonii]|uniref:Uncharacterized protein n=1 Tax=Solanum commersonii TaxID=4109 RepID=A0A9J5XCC3_SOLCO|nr:hypothetical protein H5410_045695 [Solanum commersonii]
MVWLVVPKAVAFLKAAQDGSLSRDTSRQAVKSTTRGKAHEDAFKSWRPRQSGLATGPRITIRTTTSGQTISLVASIDQPYPSLSSLDLHKNMFSMVAWSSITWCFSLVALNW